MVGPTSGHRRRHGGAADWPAPRGNAASARLCARSAAGRGLHQGKVQRRHGVDRARRRPGVHGRRDADHRRLGRDAADASSRPTMTGGQFHVDNFDSFLSLEKGSSPRTREAYHRDIERLVAYVEMRGAANPAALTSKLLRDFVYHLKDLGLAPASIRRNVSAARTYFRFLLGEGILIRDPSDRLETPKRWRTLPEVLTIAEGERLLAAPTLDEMVAFRDRAVLELAYGAGLRLSECVSLPVRDCAHDDGLIRLLCSEIIVLL